MYLIARCKNPAERATSPANLREQYPDMSVMTREEFADLTRNYWMVKTNAGVILMFIALLGPGGRGGDHRRRRCTRRQSRPSGSSRCCGPWACRSGRWRGWWWLSRFGWPSSAWGWHYPICMGLSQAALSQGIEAKLPPWLMVTTGAFVVGVAVAAGSVGTAVASRGGTGNAVTLSIYSSRL